MSPANLLLFVLLLPASVIGCGAESPRPFRSTVSVAAAANLRFAFEEIETAFELQRPEIDLRITYGSSGNFFAQLSQNAPFDIFFSADTQYPRMLVEQQLAEEASYFVYAAGRLVVWVPRDSSIDLAADGIRAIADPAVRKIAIANPRLAPYGRAAEETLRRLGIYDKVSDRLVLGENITQTAQFVESGTADVGIIALSLALAEPMQQQGRYWEIPWDACDPVEQAAVIPVACRNREAAEQLREFVAGSSAQGILRRYGYSPPKEPR